jgi:hypothetical protein
MAHITLCVTQPVLDQLDAGNKSQKQIAIKDASPELIEIISKATSANKVQIEINGIFTLTVGDTGAIWGKHQEGIQVQDFNDIFSLLSRRPGVRVPFSWK